jgi:hypothetical protein
MARRIDAPIEAMKAADAYAVSDGLAGQPCRQELPTRHDTVLSLGEPCDHVIRTLMTFDVHRTFKVTTVGHVNQDGRPYCPRETRSVTTPHRTERQSRSGAARCAVTAMLG